MTSLLCFLLALAAPPLQDEWGSVQATKSRTMSSSGSVDWNIPGTPSFLCSFDQSAGATITPEIGGFVLTKVGSVSRQTDGTWPSGIDGSQGYAHKISSANYWRAADADCGPLEPSGSFSACVVFSPDYYTGSNNFIFSKYVSTGSDRSWYIFGTNAGALRFYVSDDGNSPPTGASISNAYTLGSRIFICAAYTYTAPGSSNSATLWANGATGTSNAMEGPPYNSASDCSIGLNSFGASGRVHHAVLWKNVVITTDQYNKMYNQWRGLSDEIGSPLTISAANPAQQLIAPSDSGTEPYLVTQPVNSIMLGPYGAGFTNGTTNLARRAGFETCSAGVATGWSNTTGAGDGSAVISCDNTTFADGYTSMKFTLTGTTSYAAISGTCRTDNIGSELYAQYQGKATGTSSTTLRIRQYTTAANCTSTAVDYDIDNRALTSTWTQVEGSMSPASWDVSAQSWEVMLLEGGNGGVTTNIDSVVVRAASFPTDQSCTCDTDSDCNCTGTYITNTERKLPFSGFTFKAMIRYPAPIDAALTRTIARAAGNPSGDNNSHTMSIGSGTATYTCYNSSGVASTATISGLTGGENAYHTYLAQKYPTGYGRVCFDGVCSALSTLCSQNAQSGTFYIGSNSSAASDIWIRDVKIYPGIVGP